MGHSLNYSQSQDPAILNSRGGFATEIRSSSPSPASIPHQFPIGMNTPNQANQPPQNPTIPLKITDTTPKTRSRKPKSSSKPNPELIAKRTLVTLKPKEVPPSSRMAATSSTFLAKGLQIQQNSNSQKVFSREMTNFDTVSPQPPIPIDLESANLLIKMKQTGFLQRNPGAKIIPTFENVVISPPKPTTSHAPPTSITVSPPQARLEQSPSQVQANFPQQHNPDSNPRLDIRDTSVGNASMQILRASDLEPSIPESAPPKKAPTTKRKAVRAKRLSAPDKGLPATTSDAPSSSFIISPFQKAKTPVENASRASSRASANTSEDILSAHFDLNKDLDRPLEAEELFQEVNNRRTKKAQQQGKSARLLSREKVEEWRLRLHPQEPARTALPSHAEPARRPNSAINVSDSEHSSPGVPPEPKKLPISKQPGYKAPSYDANQKRHAARKLLKQGRPVQDGKHRLHGGRDRTTGELIETSLTKDLGLGPEGRSASNVQQANLTLAGDNIHSRGVSLEPLKTDGKQSGRSGKKSKKAEALEETTIVVSTGDTDAEATDLEARKTRKSDRRKRISAKQSLTDSHAAPLPSRAKAAIKTGSSIANEAEAATPEAPKIRKRREVGYRPPSRNFVDLRKNARRAFKLGHPLRNLELKWHGGMDPKTHIVVPTSLTEDLDENTRNNERANLTLAGKNRSSPGVSEKPLKMDGQPLLKTGRKSKYYSYASRVTDSEASGGETDAEATSIQPKKRDRPETASPTPPLVESYVAPTTRSSTRKSLPSSAPVTTRTSKRIKAGKKS